MDKKSKNFFLIFFTAVFIVTAISFYKFYLLKDYYLKLETVCDPTKEACFIYECDPAEDSQCPENPDERVSYYKLIEKKAYALPNCNPDDPNCPPPACRAGEDCREILCEEATKAEGEQCSNPEDYLKNKEQDESQATDNPRADN